MKHPSVFTIRSSAPFARTLAQGLVARIGENPLALSSTVIYLPTRRAARGFGDDFAAILGGAALLPQFKPLGDSDEEAWLFEEAFEGFEPSPPIAPLRRQLLLAQLVRRWDHRERDGMLSFAQCSALADSLAKVMDEVDIQGCDLSKLKDLAPVDLAEHWEGVTRFLDLIRDQWPAILTEEKALNPAARRILGLRRLAARLQSAPPKSWVIAAGSTGSIPATAELLGVIARLPNGAVVLPGLDQELDAQSWANLDPGHPQFGLRQLLEIIKAERGEVKDWLPTDANPTRERLLSETLRPAPTTDAWQALSKTKSQIAEGLKGMAFLACADPTQEALAIGLALREALELPGRRAALVTPDRNLARRVAAEMARWGIAIDDSAGRPLAHTAVGSFLCLLTEAAQARFAPVPLLALLKHPFARGGQEASVFRAHARELDRWCLRGPRPDSGLKGVARAIAAARSDPHNQNIAEPLARLERWWQEVAAVLAPMEKMFAQARVDIDALLEVHLAAAEGLACDENQTCPLWSNPDGEQAAALCAALKTDSQGLPPIEPGSYAPLFRSLATKVPVRLAFGRHPRLAILGPLEARLQRFDLTVLGGLNEGTWPQGTGNDPWFSRPMRATLGLDQPERSIGLAAHDFAMLAAGPAVLLTRALKAEGVPTTASRWLQRLEQLTRGLKLEAALAPKTDYAFLATQLMDVAPGPRLARPAPRPPVETRPRRLSVTEIETWLRDPYAIYARHILSLRPLDGLDEPVGALERGTLLHKAMELFIDRFKNGLPPDGAAELAAIAEQLFAEAQIPKAVLALWRPRFQGAAKGFVAFERGRRDAISTSHLEIKGSLKIGGFTLRGVADRIDILKDGTAVVLDYKTGAIPTLKQVTQLLSPQLPLEAAMLAKDGFGIGARQIAKLIYISLAGEEKARRPLIIENAAELASQAAAQLAKRIAWFDQPDTPYRARVRPFRADIAGDYDHLARVKEWSPSGWGEDT